MVTRFKLHSRTSFCIFAIFAFILFLLAPVACDNDGGGHAEDPPGSDNNWAEDLASIGASAALKGLTTAAGIPASDFVIKDIVGLIMGKIFEGGSNPDTEALNQINTELQNIENELAGIESQLSALISALDLDTSKLYAAISKAEMDPYVNQIDTLWKVYRGLHKKDANGNDVWDTNPQDIKQLAINILDLSSSKGIFPQLNGIHNLLTGEGSVSTCTLDAMRDYSKALVIDNNTDTFASYMMIENYFGSILLAQTHGATLMIEALKYREANPGMGGDYPEDATYFIGEYTAQIEDQVEVFLNEAEQFVASTAYPQKGFEAFVPDGYKILYRADLIAAWLSSRHRLDPTQPPGGQNFLVYRVIGGPDRVNQYGLGFSSSWGTQYKSILYDTDGHQDPYEFPEYKQASHHAYSDLRSGTSPYVQFMHPLDKNGGAKQKGAISDATEIWTGKYVTKPDSGNEHKYDVPYYLNDIPGHTTYTVQYQYVNSAGNPPASGDDKILFGYVFEMQHPPAMLMGDWQIVLTHDSQDGLEYGLAHWLNGSATPGSQSVYLGVEAWPMEDYASHQYDLSGNFQQENAMVGTYYWGGSSCCPVVGTSYTASIAWEVRNNGAPADRDCGTLLWVQRNDQANSYSNYNYHNVGSGTDTVQGRVAVNMVPNEMLYISLGAHMFVSWDGKAVYSENDWHHWNANYSIKLQELHFDMPQ